jgi:hypothetical protein
VYSREISSGRSSDFHRHTDNYFFQCFSSLSSPLYCLCVACHNIRWCSSEVHDILSMTAMLWNINLPMLMCRTIAVCGTMTYGRLLLPRTFNRRSGAPSYRALSDEVYIAWCWPKEDRFKRLYSTMRSYCEAGWNLRVGASSQATCSGDYSSHSNMPTAYTIVVQLYG